MSSLSMIVSGRKATVAIRLNRLVSRYSVEAPTRIEYQLEVLVITVCPWFVTVPAGLQVRPNDGGTAELSQAICANPVASYFVYQY